MPTERTYKVFYNPIDGEVLAFSGGTDIIEGPYVLTGRPPLPLRDYKVRNGSLVHAPHKAVLLPETQPE